MKSNKTKNAHSAGIKKGDGDWHVAHTSMGMGDYYGTGVKAKIGKMREGMGLEPLSKKKLKTPPTSVV